MSFKLIPTESSKNSAKFAIKGQWRGEGLEVPLPLSIVTGEAIYNLRAAIDYLAYELARFDSGCIQDGTQFPIEDNINTFWGTRWKTWLKGISDDHVIAIGQLQPGNGCDWTRTLRNISNPDKHRQLTPCDGIFDVPQNITWGEPGTFDGRHGTVYPGKGPGGLDLYAEFNLSLFVEFSDKTRVTDTLDFLCRCVGETLDAFKPEFK